MAVPAPSNSFFVTPIPLRRTNVHLSFNHQVRGAILYKIRCIKKPTDLTAMPDARAQDRI